METNFFERHLTTCFVLTVMAFFAVALLSWAPTFQQHFAGIIR